MIRIATKEDVNIVSNLASNMWGNKQELINEFNVLLENNKFLVK